MLLRWWFAFESNAFLFVICVLLLSEIVKFHNVFDLHWTLQSGAYPGHSKMFKFAFHISLTLDLQQFPITSTQ